MNCLSPFLVKTRLGHFTLAPCGQCMPCRVNRTKQTGIRLLHECSYWKDSVFVTFTYDEEHVRRYPCGKFYVEVSDLKNFWKSLREDKEVKGKIQFKYYAVAEFGDESGRSHFHAILYGFSIRHKKLLQKHWKFGFLYVGSVTNESCNYVAGYVQKKLTGKAAKPKPDSICQYVPTLPKAMTSGGLGLRYAKDHEQQFIDVGLTSSGKKIGIPRYYRQKLPRLDANLLLKSEDYAISDKCQDEKSYLYDISPEALEHKWQKFCEARDRASMKRSKL